MAKDERYLGFHNEFMCEPKPEKGVYAIFLQSSYLQRPRLMYIGSSKNIRNRVTKTNHWYMYLYKRCYQGVVLKYIYCDNYLKIEKEMIKKHKPLLNKIYNGRK